MKRTPRVAIIVLNYNGEECLFGALDSLQKLDYTEKNIIVVDNDSRDESFEMAKKGFPTCIFLKNTENLGFARGMNVGIREAFRIGADYVWLFNNDAIAAEDSLRKLVDFCEDEILAGAVSPIIMDQSGKEWFVSGKISYIRMRTIHGKKKNKIHPYQSEYLSGCALLIRRSVLEEVGLLDERYFLYYEDADLSFRIRQAGKRLFIVPSACVWHAERSEKENPRKIYHLVYSGLLFFHDHTPILLRPWLWGYEFLRRMKNRSDVFSHRAKARMVEQAYQDYDRNDQSH